MDIHELLKGQNLEIPEENRKDFEKSFFEHFKSQGEVAKKSEALKTLQAKYDEDIKAKDDALAELQKQLNSEDSAAKKVEKLNSRIAELQEESKKAKEEYDAAMEAAKYKSAVNELVSDLKFSSPSAKELFTMKLNEKKLKFGEDGNLMGFNDFVKDYKSFDANAFVENDSDNAAPKFSAPTSGHVDPNAGGEKHYLGVVR